MILSDEELKERLDSPLNLMNRLRNVGAKNALQVLPMSVGNKGESVPSRVRELLGVLAVSGDESQDDIANEFGVSQGLISQVSRGLSNTRVDADIKATVDEARLKRAERTDTAHDEALDAMVDCLTLLKPQLRGIEKPEKLAKIAGDMSKIISNIKKKDDDAKVNSTQVIIYAPSQVNETHYETIEA